MPEKKFKYTNRKARNYLFAKKIEAGVALTGAEVKSIKTKGISLDQSSVQIFNNEAYLINAHIPGYQFSTDRPYDPRANRKLLVKKKELEMLIEAKQQKLAIVPINCYNNRGWIKLLIGIGRHKQIKEKKSEAITRSLKKRLKQQPENI